MEMTGHATNDEIVQITDAEGGFFAALGLPNAAEASEKADLVYEITRAIREAGMTQAQAAARAGVTATVMSRILRGRTEHDSVAQLERVLTGLGRDVVKVVTPTARADGRGAVSVVYAETAPVPLTALLHTQD